MAATLVGLMWWDRPMDEAMPRAPAPAAERIEAPRNSTPAKLAASAAAAPTAPETTDATPSATAPVAPAPARRAKAAEAERAEPANAKDAFAKERSRSAAPTSDKPAAFPAAPAQRPEPAPLADAKKEAAPMPLAGGPAPVLAPTPAPPAATQRQAPQAAAQTAAAQPSLARGRIAGDEASERAPDRIDGGSARSAAPRDSLVEAKRDAAPAAPPAAFGGQHEKSANATAPLGAAARSEAPTELRRAVGSVAAAPLAPLLAALAGDSTRVTRQGANGWVALDPAWRTWLTELDAATAGHWRRAVDADAAADVDAAKQVGAPVVLRLDGRPAAILRIGGATVQLESQIGAPERWQALLAPAAGERLRGSLARLPP